MTTHRVLRIGDCEVRLAFDGKDLVAVELPKKVPAQFDRKALRQLNSKLAAFKSETKTTSDFRRCVWSRMARIPAGEVLTYSELAAEIKRPKAVRAVGSAVGANRLLLLMPCHRVVAKRGLGGFRCGLAWKKKLLELEAARVG